MKFEKTILYIILGIVLMNFFNRQCSTAPQKESPKISIVKDTVWQTKTDTFKIQITSYKTVYVDTTDVSKIFKNTNKNIIQNRYTEAKAYRDTLSNDDIDVFSYSLVKGKLLDSEISYKLKVPREITTTKTIEHPKTYRSGLYLFSEVGGNITQFNNISLGLQYNQKSKWFVSYRLNLNTIQQPTHNVGVGYRLFK
ncbi:hypothetical protein [Winogradskyella sp.]|jgi:hypothetical protein|uniref:hypothetical protein n=1 Tax=Winogradskyella sp. TaxID=1883156 RepID=UPI0025EED35A|nr:hypothetical protein [Winogradskyella sp.]MCT4629335.1 hypothetical protein [Winogradskyella sp.]